MWRALTALGKLTSLLLGTYLALWPEDVRPVAAPVRAAIITTLETNPVAVGLVLLVFWSALLGRQLLGPLVLHGRYLPRLRYVRLRDAVKRMRTGASWGRRFDTDDAFAHDIGARLTDLAQEGQLTVLARRRDGILYHRIDRKDWLSVNLVVLAENGDWTVAPVARQGASKHVADLLTSHDFRVDSGELQRHFPGRHTEQDLFNSLLS